MSCRGAMEDSSRCSNDTDTRPPCRQRRMLDYILSERYAGQETWRCPACHAHFENPVSLSCGDVICRDCATVIDSVCVTCHEKVTDQFPPARLIQKIVETVQCHCPNKALGCNVPLGALVVERHLREECEWREEECPRCHQLVRHAEMGRHQETTCAGKHIACGYADVGCPTSCPQGDMAAHEVAAVVAHTGLLRQQLAATSQQLAQTRQELAATREELAQTKGELATAKALTTQTQQEFASAKADLKGELKGDLAQTRQELTSDLAQTKGELTTAKRDLAQTRTELTATKTDLAQTRQEVTATKADLAPTKRDLAQTRQELTATKADLAQTKGELATIKGTLTQTRQELVTTKGDLAQTRTRLDQVEASLPQTRQELAELAERVGRVMPHSLCSELTASGNSYHSICFNVKNKSTSRLRIRTISFARQNDHRNVHVRIFCTKDQHRGFEPATDADHWQLLAEGHRDFTDYKGGRTGISSFPLALQPVLDADDLMGFWIQTDDAYGVEYGNEVPLGTVSMQDDNLVVMAGPRGDSSTPFTSRGSSRKLTGTVIDYELA
ncbi:putative septation ring formation regulator; EzrA family protein [Paratrimastix pyriformis]|uniref:Septation ring formation regulator n=1 Tax=Paratrimastix pyriformis TaxID=342808 RepID=A0ABQ8UFP4_9EUKA|nr:putative septation ring formation regulator; EzrA family protein [Paratrimastix pyriformis]